MTLERSFHPTIPPCVNFFIQEAYKWVHPQSWKHFWVAFEISKLCSKFSRQLDGNSWDDQIANGSINTFPTFFFNPFNHPPCVCQRLLVIPSSPVPYSSLTASSVWSVTVAGKWATVSNLSQPASSSCWPFAATAAPLATLPRSLCPSSRFFFSFFFHRHLPRRRQHPPLRCCLSFHSSFFRIPCVTNLARLF